MRKRLMTVAAVGCSIAACTGVLASMAQATTPGTGQGLVQSRARAVQAASTAGRRGVLRILAGIPQSNESLGRSTARVVVQLYGDLGCSVCRDFVLSRAFARLISQDVRTGKVRIVYRSFCTATCNAGPGRRVFVSQQVAAYAAGAQRRFWQYAMLFLQHQGSEGTDYATEAFLDRLAREDPGLEFARWLSERTNPALARELKAEDRAANRQNIQATPTLIFTGPRGVMRVVGIPSFKQLDGALTRVS